MVRFIDDHRDVYGLESICTVMPIAPSTYFLHKVLAGAVRGRAWVTKTQADKWRSSEAVEFATLTWVDWFNTRPLLEPIGYVPPAEFEARYSEQAAVA